MSGASRRRTDGEPPKTVEYEIFVKNESKAASITVESVTDANVPACNKTGLSIVVLAGEEKLVSTCSKEYTTEGVFKNAALAKAAGKEKESNEVEAELESKKFSVVKKQRFEG